ncbi:SMP-30/gluconolactonase/LRE family protein [Aporhodopirellula aestuarii]|uniref:SMP-30/gluconolactonase/LRE family protein n=1 Tax=Aporhodopirellula aestuarii TaxID=2950107 RepID=A0ABT0UBS8_9BACT|nr:SMP-30/gluconolactonase/LRE family protein [Aporhodopirellula aestuarii]MCM2373823.1 SMP-30/gluconolactonase/LRE family protein [Aporhodopirellula aestuarii]
MSPISGPVVREATALSIPDRDSLRFLPEGPIALSVDGWLSWVAIQHGKSSTQGSINLLNLDSCENTSFDLPGRPGFAFACQSDSNHTMPTRFVAGVERSLGIFDTVDLSWSPFCENIDADVDNTIINDGVICGDNLIFGTKDLDFSEKKAGLYLYRASDKALIRLRDDQVCSNGKMIRTDDSGRLKLIDIDSPTKLIVEYDLDVDAGTIGEEKTLIDLTDDPGVPDGAVLTPDGSGVIVSIYLPEVAEFGQTRWYDLATGELKCVWRTPGSPRNTCPALVPRGDRMRLVITTAVEGMPDEELAGCPQAGQIFVAETDFDIPSGFTTPSYPC